MMKRLFGCALSVLALSAMSVGTAQAQSYPTRAVKIVTYYSPGSGPDIVIRIVADNLNKLWGQPVIVENKPGANGIIATDALKNSPPDGYTLGVADDGVLTINPHLYSSMKLQADRDLTPIMAWMNVPFYLIVPASGSIKTVPELIAQAKAKPGKLSYGSPTGIGNPGHLGMELFKAETGTDMLLVPYKVSGLMLTDLSTNTLQAAWASLGSSRAMIQTGTVVPIAVGTRARQAARPDVPTLKEAGGPPNLDVDSFIGMLGPKDMPKDLVAKINADVGKVLQMPEVAKKIIELGNEPLVGDGEKLGAMIRERSARYGKLIKDLNIKAE